MGRWQRGDGRLIVATNAFGLGIDAPDVRVVIHVGAIYQMWNYSQESGRGGRDGQRSEAIVVMPAGKQEVLRKKRAKAQARTQPWKIQSRVMSAADTKQIEWDKMERFLSGEKCRRIFLDAEMDGRETEVDKRANRLQCEEGEERCDVCERDDATMAESEAQRAAYIQEEQERQDRWMDSGIDVPSSSVPAQKMDIPSSSVGFPRSSPLPSSDVDKDHDHDCISASARCSYSPGSSASFDQGFAADTMAVHEQNEFTTQQAQRRQQRWRTVVEEQDEGHEVWDLENQLDSWVGKCPLCYVRQCQGWDVDVQYTLDVCPDELQEKVATEAELLSRVRFEKFASCMFCGVAQKICTRWAEIGEGSNRFREVKGGVCQYVGIVQPAVAAMTVAAPLDVVKTGLYDQMKAEGIWGRGSEWGSDEEAEVKRVMMIWFAKKII
jgi:hypothetical protein